jgi:PAS domain-containing protein
MSRRRQHIERRKPKHPICDQSKTEAIIEALEDGIILINPDRVVAHLNEVAAIILGIERSEAIGSRFEEPQY